jgi:hypothetical protein
MATQAAISITTADLVRRVTSLRVTALSANDATVQQAACDDGEAEAMSRLCGGCLPAYSSMTTTGQQRFQFFALEYAYYHLLVRLAKLTDADKAERERTDAAAAAARLDGFGPVGEPRPASFLYSDGPALVFRPGTSDEGGTMWGR